MLSRFSEFIIIISLFVELCLFGIVSECRAQSERITLARALRAECGNHCSTKEIITILYVLKKRKNQYNKNNVKQRTLEQQTKAYCPVFRRKHKKARLIKRSTFEKPLQGKKEWWNEIGKIIDLFNSGLLVDPYPAAMHWNCPTCNKWAIKYNMKLVVKMYNTFWR